MLLICLLILIVVNYLKIENKYKVLIMFILVSLVSIFTFGLGTDYFSYEYIFKHLTMGGTLNGKTVEPLFSLITQTFRLLNISYHTYISILRIFILTLTTKWIMENSSKPAVTFTLYFSMFYLVWTMSAIRQGLVLAIGLNLFYSQKFELSFIKKSILAILMMGFHYSSAFYIILFIAEKIEWSKKRHLGLLLVSLLFTFLPISKIVEALDFLPYMIKISQYIEPNFGFFDVGSLMRLVFFGITIYYYDVLKLENFQQKITDSFLFGVNIYFLLKFSEIVAGRFTIYSFIFIIFILTVLYENIEIKLEVINTRPIIMSTMLIMVSFLFLGKEVNAYRGQVGYKGPNNFFSVDSIFNYSYFDYDNTYAFREGQINKSQMYIDRLQNSSKSFDLDTFNNNSDYTSVKINNSGNFGIISTEGTWIKKPELKTNNHVYGKVMVSRDSKGSESLITREIYEDLSGEIKDQNILRKSVSQTLYDQNLIEVKSENMIGMSFENIIKNPESFVPYPENVSSSNVVKIIHEDFYYYVLQFKYYSYNLNIYLDQDFVPFEEIVFTNFKDFSPNNFLFATTYSGTIVFNKNGKVIFAQ